MRDGLSGVLALIDHQAIAKNPELLGYEPRRVDEARVAAFGTHLGDPRYLLPRDEEHMDRCLGVDVAECDAELVFVHDVRGDFPVDDLGEESCHESILMPKAECRTEYLYNRGMAKFRSDLGTLILATIGAAELHGYEILKRIRALEAGALQLGEGQLYPLLHRLEEDGLIAGQWQDQPDGRPRRKSYTLTDEGFGALEQGRQEWRTFALAMERVMRPQEA